MHEHLYVRSTYKHTSLNALLHERGLNGSHSGRGTGVGAMVVVVVVVALVGGGIGPGSLQ